MSWIDTKIENRGDGWWCGGQCWGTEAAAQQHKIRLTTCTQSPITHDGLVTRHTQPATRPGGTLGYDIWFEFGGQKYSTPREAMRHWRDSR